MNNFEAFLVDLLQDRITYDDRTVYVSRNWRFETDQVPIITLDLGAGTTTEYYYNDLDVSDTLYAYRTSNIDINVWCNTEEERESITQQILNCWHREKRFHYTYCTKYMNQSCECMVDYIHNGSTAKGKCPDIDFYGYEGLTKKHSMQPGSITIEPQYMLDDPTEEPPLLRSIIRAKGQYYEQITPHEGEVVDVIDVDDVTIH